MSMDALEFLKERKRMCNSYKGCGGCPLEGINCSIGIGMSDKECERIITAVEQWSKERPRKTRQSAFLKQYPNAPLDGGALVLCPRAVDFTYTCPISEKRCKVCRKQFWSQEVHNESDH